MLRSLRVRVSPIDACTASLPSWTAFDSAVLAKKLDKLFGFTDVRVLVMLDAAADLASSESCRSRACKISAPLNSSLSALLTISKISSLLYFFSCTLLSSAESLDEIEHQHQHQRHTLRQDMATCVSTDGGSRQRERDREVIQIAQRFPRLPWRPGSVDLSSGISMMVPRRLDYG